MDTLERKMIEDLKHEINIARESIRHKKKNKKIWEDSGLDYIVNLKKQIDEEVKETSEKREKFKHNLSKFIYFAVGRQKVSINKTITIRDGKVFFYNKSSEATIFNICSSIDKIIENFESDYHKEIASKVTEEIEKTGLKNKRSRIEKVYRKTENYYISYDIEDSKVNITDEKLEDSMKDYERLSLDGKDISIKEVNFDGDIKYSNMKSNYIKKLERNREEIEFILEEALEEIRDRKMMERRMYDKFENIISPVLVPLNL